MLQQNPLRLEFYQKYQEIIDAYNDGKDLKTVREALEKLKTFVDELTIEDTRAIKEKLDAMKKAKEMLKENIEFHQFIQYEFSNHWNALKEFSLSQGVAMMGDVPIFLAYDSADVWAHRDLFYLKEDGSPEVVSGVQPAVVGMAELLERPAVNHGVSPFRKEK